jgi:uncharacterized protein (DUF1778 family)
MGRVKYGDTIKNKFFQMRVTAEERALLEVLASSAGITVAQWILKAAREEFDRQASKPWASKPN